MTFNNKLALMTGQDLPIPELQLTIHQPTIREIALIGDLDFFIGVQCLNIHKEAVIEDKSVLSNINNFQIFMTVMQEKESADKRYAVDQLMTLLFPNYRIIFTPRSLIISKEDFNITIDENNFDFLQRTTEDIFCSRGPMDAQSFNPKDTKAKAIADKLMRARQRVAAQREEGSGSVFVQYVSVLTVGLNSMSLQNCLDLTMYQLFDLIERYSLWLNWDLDVKSRLAGGSPDSKPDNWMKNIH